MRLFGTRRLSDASRWQQDLLRGAPSCPRPPDLHQEQPAAHHPASALLLVFTGAQIPHAPPLWFLHQSVSDSSIGAWVEFSPSQRVLTSSLLFLGQNFVSAHCCSCRDEVSCSSVMTSFSLRVGLSPSGHAEASVPQTCDSRVPEGAFRDCQQNKKSSVCLC